MAEGARIKRGRPWRALAAQTEQAPHADHAFRFGYVRSPYGLLLEPSGNGSRNLELLGTQPFGIHEETGELADDWLAGEEGTARSEHGGELSLFCDPAPNASAPPGAQFGLGSGREGVQETRRSAGPVKEGSG